MFEGVNVIRLLDNELNSISERVVYNVTENNTKLNITSTLKTKESLNIKASIPNKIGNFSISVLPKNTKSNYNHSNIQTNLAFKNYFESEDFDTSYYFSNFNKRKAFELDLMLLHVKESKYNWSRILKDAPKPTHSFDMGITVSGKINQNVPNKQNTKQLSRSTPRPWCPICPIPVAAWPTNQMKYLPKLEKQSITSWLKEPWRQTQANLAKACNCLCESIRPRATPHSIKHLSRWTKPGRHGPNKEPTPHSSIA